MNNVDINLNSLRTSLNELRQSNHAISDEIEQTTDETSRKIFLDFSEKYPTAFDNPPESLKNFNEGVRRFISVARNFPTKKWEIGESLEEIIAKIDAKAAIMSFWMLSVATHEDNICESVTDELNGKDFKECYPILLSRLQDSKSLRNRVCLNKDLKMQMSLKDKGYFALPGGLERVSPNLRRLYLPMLWIKVMTAAIGRFSFLAELNLSVNLITSVPDEIGALTNLRNLDLSHNKIEKLPETISGCIALERLNLSNNPIDKLPSGLVDLLSLKKVDMRSTSYDPKECQTYTALVDRGVVVKLGDLSDSKMLPGSSMFSALGSGRRTQGPTLEALDDSIEHLTSKLLNSLIL